MLTRYPFRVRAVAIAGLLLVVGVVARPAGGAEDVSALARQILDATGVRGGLVVQVGAGDGRLTAALHAGDAYLVHGLEPDPVKVEAARATIRAAGSYGPVSVMHWTGNSLPYADGLVNLLVAEDLGGVPMAEVMRVLAPKGVVYLKTGRQWKKTVKPWPDDIDEWTHHLHGPGGNAVARDAQVGPPRYLQWTAGPRWARSHGWTPSVSAMVSAGGRLFAIVDETLTCVDGTVPSKWFVVARDAFSGVLLWKHPVPNWDSKFFSGTPGHDSIVPRFTMPPHIGKRMVADGETVYVTLGAEAPVTALDAATGKVRRVYADTARADELLLSDGRLIVTINPANRPAGGAPDPAPGKRICAVDAGTGRLLWRGGPFTAVRTTKQQDPYGRLELAAGDGSVFALTDQAITALDAATGEVRWHIDRPSLPASAVTKLGYGGVYEYLLPVLVYEGGVVLLAQPEPNTHHTYHTMPGTLYAFDAGDGRLLWKHGYGGWGHCTPPDVFVIDDTVWTHVNAETKFGSVWGKGFKAIDTSKPDYRIQALDLRTGHLQREISTKEIFNVGHHHRCYRNKITERFLMSCRRGVEFVNLATGENYQDHWVRSGCLLGYVPANGLLYVAPHPCGCYITAKLVGFNALASDPGLTQAAAGSVPAAMAPAPPETPDAKRLERGPSYGQIGNRKSEAEKGADWPTYRHDGRRSGATDAAVGTNLKVAWRTRVGTKPSGLVIADGRVLVADVDGHTVHALAAADGAKTWSYTAGGRVDSPPTVHKGLALFGSADGHVYCVRAADGVLVWRFDAAPRPRLVTAFDQLESAWPVHGSILVDDDKAWFAAGRSSYLDGGIRLWALDPATGKVLRRETVYHPDPKTGKMAPDPAPHDMVGLLNDIPATDGANVFIRQMAVATTGGRGGPHLYTSGGYLDPSWFNRTFWQVGKARTSGVMVLGEDAAYGMEVYASRSRETVFRPGSKAYRLRCMPLTAPAKKAAGKQPARMGRNQQPPTRWERRVDIRVIALVRAGDVLFAAGPPDVVDPKDPHGAWEGRKGGVLAAFSTADGKELARFDLPAPPVWDGLAAAGGRLYVALASGEVACFAPK